PCSRRRPSIAPRGRPRRAARKASNTRARSSGSGSASRAARRSGGVSLRSWSALRRRCRFLRDRQTRRIPLANDEIADREQHRETEERARRQHGREDAVEWQLDRESIAAFAEEERRAGEERALASD